MHQTFLPPEEVHVDDNDVYMMNNGDRPLNIAESEEAERVLDDPSCIQQKMDMPVVATTKPLRHMNHSPSTKLGLMLLAERAKRGWTYTAAANAIGLDRREVAKIEQGKPPVPHIDKLKKFIDAYGMDTKTVLRVYSRMKSKYEYKKLPITSSEDVKETTKLVESVLGSEGCTVPTENENLTDWGESLDSVISADEQEPSTTAPEIDFEMGRRELEETLTKKICGLNSCDLCKVAIQAGIPVHVASDGTLKIVLHAQCPLCHIAINSDDIVVSKEIPGMISNHCRNCNTTFLVPYEAMLAAGARIEKKILLNEKNSI